MTPQRFTSLLLLLSLAACSGRSAPPRADAGDTDSATADAARDTGTAEDASVDSSMVDSGASDSGASDSGASDSGASDSGASDSGSVDAGVSDTGVGDAGRTDSGAGDAGSSDAGIPAAGVTYLVTRDTRRCAYPACGGFWLEAVNQADTLCDDGSRADRCYAVDLDWTAMGLTDTRVGDAEGAVGGLLVKGSLQTADFVGGARLGHVVVADAWLAEWGTPASSSTTPPFYVSADNGLRCLVDPCFNHELTRINVGGTDTASSLDLSMVGASRAQQMAGLRADSTGELRVTGVLADDATPSTGGLGRTLTATQFYLPVGR